MSEDFGEGEIFYRHYITRQDSYNALEKLMVEEEKKLKSNTATVTKSVGESKPKPVPEKETKSPPLAKKNIFTLKRALFISAFIGVCSYLTQAYAGPQKRENVLGVFYSVIFLGVFDLVCAMHTVARWYWIHAAGNMIVAITALPDLCEAFANPQLSSTGGDPSMYPIYMIPAIHLYHLFFFKCSRADWVHHVVFAGIICPMGLFLKTGPVANAVAFFICGLPGGLDYIMLACVKHQWMSKLREKVWNARINVWIRSTGLVFCAATIYVGATASHSKTPAWAALLGALLCVVNGQYYMQVVVGNTFVKTRQGEGAVAYNS